MKYTLLDVVQAILSSLDSDEVNSITDTVESMQAAVVAKTAYLDIASVAGLAEVKTLFELEASNDVNLPCIMYKPEDIMDIDWIKYNTADLDDGNVPFFKTVEYMDLDNFLDRMYNIIANNEDSVQGTLTLGNDSITLLWKDNVSPTYWTSFDDRTIMFDSYDSDVDSTLMKTKSLGYGESALGFSMSDSFIPQLDEKQHALWLNEAKALAWAELKQAVHQRAERSARRGWINLSLTKRGVPTHISELQRAPNYGRNGGYGPRYSTVKKRNIT